jgi:hypothetical protein
MIRLRHEIIHALLTINFISRTLKTYRKGSFWVTNEISNKRLPKGKKIPNGFKLGRTVPLGMVTNPIDT